MRNENKKIKVFLIISILTSVILVGLFIKLMTCNAPVIIEPSAPNKIVEVNIDAIVNNSKCANALEFNTNEYDSILNTDIK